MANEIREDEKTGPITGIYQKQANSALGNNLNYPALEFDCALFDDLLNDPETTPEQRRELGETLWAIAVACVDLNIGIHPLQQACEQNELYQQLPAFDWADVVDLEGSAKTEFEMADAKLESASDSKVD